MLTVLQESNNNIGQKNNCNVYTLIPRKQQLRIICRQIFIQSILTESVQRKDKESFAFQYLAIVFHNFKELFLNCRYEHLNNKRIVKDVVCFRFCFPGR